MKEIKLELPIVDLSGVCEAMNELKKAVEEYGKRDVIVRLGTALIESGVKCSAVIEGSDEEVILDFSEHDKKVAELKDRKIIDLEEEASELRKELISKNERIIELINEIEEIKKDWCFARMSELEDRHQSDCIRINQLLTTIDVLTERYQKLREVHGL